MNPLAKSAYSVRNLLRGLALALATCFATGCAHYGIPMHEIAPEVNGSLYRGPYLIQPGDNLRIGFPRKEIWNTEAVVRNDGRISMPELGEVLAAGQSSGELQGELARRYSLNPQDIVINLVPLIAGPVGGNNAVTVTGELNTPGIQALSGGPITLVEAFGRAGGQLNPTSLLANTLLVRRSPATGLQQSWRIDARHRHWGKGDPIYLQAGDFVFVPNHPVDDLNNWFDEYINQNIPGASILGLLIGIAITD